MENKLNIARAIVVAVLMCGLVVLVNAAAAQDYDIVIENGRVMDPEKLYDGVANVGIKDGRIVQITREAIAGKEVIDATDHVVAPGFIDTHFHWQRTLGYKIGVRDGLTSNLDIELGAAGTKVGQWYADRAGKSPANYGTGSSMIFR